jgi:hypothetical protein
MRGRWRGWESGAEGRGRLVRLKGEEAENSKAQSRVSLVSLKGGGNGLSVDEFRYRFLCVFYFCKIAPFLCVSCKLLFIGEVWHGHKHIVLSIFIFFIIF